MNILYLARWYPNRFDPMPGLFIERHARAAAAFCQVSVLYVHPDPDLKGRLFETEWTEDEEIVQLKLYYRPFKGFSLVAPSMNLLRYYRMHYKGYRLLREKRGKPDLLHVNVLTRLGVLALIFKWITGTPYVITEHWTRYLPQMDNFRGLFRKAATRLACQCASAILPVTDNLKKAMESHGVRNRNWVIVPNVVDGSLFVPAARPEQKGKKRFIHVSCFEDRQKNISGILRVLKRLSAVRQDWECHMVGDGIHYDKLIRMSDELGLTSSFVYYHGLQENESLVKLMQDARFMVMFSRFENLPVVILESFFCGVPVLSTDVGGISEHMPPGLGVLIPSEDEESLFTQLNSMLDQPEKFNPDLIRSYAMDHFSKEVIGKNLELIYREAVRKRKEGTKSNKS